MHKCVSKSYTLERMNRKDVGVRVRVERDLRDAFVQACPGEQRTAAQVIRDFMREYVDRAQRGQGELFRPSSK